MREQIYADKGLWSSKYEYTLSTIDDIGSSLTRFFLFKLFIQISK